MLQIDYLTPVYYRLSVSNCFVLRIDMRKDPSGNDQPISMPRISGMKPPYPDRQKSVH